MTRMIWFITTAMACHLSTVELRASEAQTNFVPAFVEQTNGSFAVCAFDSSRRVLLRFRGVEIRRVDVPPTGPYRNVPIYALGDRPPVTDPWKPRQEDLYNYGRPPYPIEEIDPPFEEAVNKDGALIVGFPLRGRFYAVKEVKKPQLKKNIPKKFWSKVVPVDVPVHRQEELKVLLEETVAVAKSDSPSDKLPAPSPGAGTTNQPMRGR